MTSAKHMKPAPIEAPNDSDHVPSTDQSHTTEFSRWLDETRTTPLVAASSSSIDCDRNDPTPTALVIPTEVCNENNELTVPALVTRSKHALWNYTSRPKDVRGCHLPQLG
jgi:hypothetical protein